MCGIFAVLNGVFLSAIPWRISTSTSSVCCRSPSPADQFLQAIANRGPDSLSSAVVAAAENDSSVTLGGAVLHLRGPETTRQPYAEATETSSTQGEGEGSSSALCWNGEMFGSVTVPLTHEDASDTVAVYRALCLAESGATTSEEFALTTRSLLEGVAGPYAFIFYSARWNMLLFGRDSIGRRSLVLHTCQGQTALSSVAVDPHRLQTDVSGNPGTCNEPTAAATATTGVPSSERKPFAKRGRVDDEHGGERAGGGEEDDDGAADAEKFECWSEVPIDGIYSVTLPRSCSAGTSSRSAELVLIPWTGKHRVHPLFGPVRAVPYESQGLPPSTTLLAPDREVASSVGTATTIPTFHSLAEGQQRLQAHLQGVGYTHDPTADAPLEPTLEYLAALSQSVDRRVCLSSRAECPSHPITVLFSGGIDSVVLAALTHLHTPMESPIELINVAFGDFPEQTPDRVAAHNAFVELKQLPGDRRPWRLLYVNVSHEEVRQTRERILGLVYPRMTVMDYNIGTAIWFAVKGSGYLVPPETIVSRDLKNKLFRVGGDSSAGGAAESVGTPFDALVEVLVQEGTDSPDGGDGGGVFFSTLGKDYGKALQPAIAAQGCKKLGPFLDVAEKAGVIRITGGKTGKCVRLVREEDIRRADEESEKRKKAREVPKTPYQRQGRVIILGMGADETLAGYVRHYRLFQREGEEGLRREMERDFERLWERNLGRDDRIVSDHGTEGRFPFLDERVLSVLSSFPRDQANPIVCNFRVQGGDKWILRTAARLLGLSVTSKLQKRAIQFGTRIANRKVQGGTPLNACNPETDLHNPRTMQQKPAPSE